MTISVTTLCDNLASFGFLSEWGLSLLISRDQDMFLLDTGMTDVALKNACSLEVPLQKIKHVILSHGHIDHSGGLEHFLKKISVQIIGGPEIFEKKYSSRHIQANQDISMPTSKEKIEKYGSSILLTEKHFEIAPGIITSGIIPMVTDFEKCDPCLLTLKDNQQVQDSFYDDLACAVDTSLGLVIILGCAHRGPVNTILHFMELTGNKKIFAVIGGLHLSNADDKRIGQTVDFFKKTGIKKIACSHCTGFKAKALLYNTFLNDFIENYSGKKLFF